MLCTVNDKNWKLTAILMFKALFICCSFRLIHLALDRFILYLPLVNNSVKIFFNYDKNISVSVLQYWRCLVILLRHPRYSSNNGRPSVRQCSPPQQARSHGGGGGRGGLSFAGHCSKLLDKFEPPLAGLGCPPWHFIGIGIEVYSPPPGILSAPPTNDTWLRRCSPAPRTFDRVQPLETIRQMHRSRDLWTRRSVDMTTRNTCG